MHSSRRRGFTLVELLVVIAIIGALVALLLPAVQSVRRTARRTQCIHNLKQLSLGCIAHESAQGHFPSAGWAQRWSGDADRGFGRDQPGGWIYNILPFIEQNELRNLPSDGQPNVITDEQREGASQMIQSTIPGINCPSRRPNEPFPVWDDENRMAYNSAEIPFEVDDYFVGQSDYAISGGHDVFGAGSPRNLREAQLPWTWAVDEVGNMTFARHTQEGFPVSEDYLQYVQPVLSGVSFGRSQVRSRHLEDGASHVYLLGEKAFRLGVWRVDLATRKHDTSRANEFGNWSLGGGYHNHRFATVPPKPDCADLKGGGTVDYSFGSAHSSGLHMSFCDGHVEMVAYDVDPMIHRQTAHRSDGGRLLRIGERTEVWYTPSNGFNVLPQNHPCD